MFEIDCIRRGGTSCKLAPHVVKLNAYVPLCHPDGGGNFAMLKESVPV
ncbi:MULTISPECIES: hypothetical protein [Reichenbachiella]|nr:MULTISPECIES: hypothetical protein [Reichenbachiella]MBU2914248.1 hypothetical protein [Reichenbachiella agariperforans]